MYTNIAILQGNILNVTEPKTTNGGVPFCKISLETALQYNTPAGLRKDSEIHHVVVYGKLSKTCQRLKKGVRACIEGSIKPSTNEIIADRIEWERMVGQEI